MDSLEKAKNVRSPELSIIDSISGSELTGLTSSVLELAIDSLIEDEFLRSVPIVGSIVQAGKAAIAIRDRLFLRKVCGFLLELEAIPQEKRQRFVSSLEDQGERRKTGEALCLLLDQIDRLEKASLIGRLFRAAITGKIETADVLHISFAINQTFIDDLARLASSFDYLFSREIRRRWSSDQLLDDDANLRATYQRLAATGILIARYPEKSVYDDENPQRFSVSEIGLSLLEFGLLDNHKRCTQCRGEGKVFRTGTGVLACEVCEGTGRIEDHAIPG